MTNKHRSKRFKRNVEVENILGLLERYMSPVEDKIVFNNDASDYSPIFIFGCARSGTTLIHQYLIENLKSIYPSNFLSRFYYAPYLGGLYYKLFVELDEKGELLGGGERKIKDFFNSDLGKTKGIHSPNEFWYFWRKHFPINKKGTLDRDKINQAQAIRFRNSIFALQNLYDGPFITKGMIANNCIEILDQLFPEPLFIFIKRDLFANAKSLYEARINYFNDPAKWYSFYPKEKENYQGLNPEEQVVRQVMDTNEEIEKSLTQCNNNRIINIDYADFCEAPGQLLEMISNIVPEIKVNKISNRPAEFTAREKMNLINNADKKISEIIESIDKK